MSNHIQSGFEPVHTKESIVDLIIHSITDSIISGKYSAGMKLPSEYELIDEMKVSRNSLREAMKILSAMGIVEIKRGDGTYVCSQMSPSMFDTVVYSMIYNLSTNAELLELRQILDEATVRLSMEKITEDEIKELRENIRKMADAIALADLELLEKIDYEFHMKLLDTCKNVFFIRMVKGVYSIFRKSISANLEKEKSNSMAAIYHLKLLECIEDKDYEKVSKAVADSLSTWNEVIHS